jgi:hypothetical protein
MESICDVKPVDLEHDVYIDKYGLAHKWYQWWRELHWSALTNFDTNDPELALDTMELPMKIWTKELGNSHGRTSDRPGNWNKPKDTPDDDSDSEYDSGENDSDSAIRLNGNGRSSRAKDNTSSGKEIIKQAYRKKDGKTFLDDYSNVKENQCRSGDSHFNNGCSKPALLSPAASGVGRLSTVDSQQHFASSEKLNPLPILDDTSRQLPTFSNSHQSRTFLTPANKHLTDEAVPVLSPSTNNHKQLDEANLPTSIKAKAEAV